MKTEAYRPNIDNTKEPPKTMKDSNTKRESAKKINEIQNKIQGIYFDLEEFQDYDSGNIARRKALEMLEATGSVLNRILQVNQEKQNGSG